MTYFQYAHSFLIIMAKKTSKNANIFILMNIQLYQKKIKLNQIHKKISFQKTLMIKKIMQIQICSLKYFKLKKKNYSFAYNKNEMKGDFKSPVSRKKFSLNHFHENSNVSFEEANSHIQNSERISSSDSTSHAIQMEGNKLKIVEKDSTDSDSSHENFIRSIHQSNSTSPLTCEESSKLLVENSFHKNIPEGNFENQTFNVSFTKQVNSTNSNFPQQKSLNIEVEQQVSVSNDLLLLQFQIPTRIKAVMLNKLFLSKNILLYFRIMLMKIQIRIHFNKIFQRNILSNKFLFQIIFLLKNKILLLQIQIPTRINDLQDVFCELFVMLCRFQKNIEGFDINGNELTNLWNSCNISNTKFNRIHFNWVKQVHSSIVSY
jgi:hypothetical protein